MSRTRSVVSVAIAAASLVGILVGTLGTAVLFSVDLPGLTSLAQRTRVTFVIATLAVLLITWVLFYLERNALIEELRTRLARARGLQDAVDGLSVLRSEGVNTLFAGTPKAEEFEDWVNRFLDWEKRVKEYMKPRFTGAMVGLFSELGAVPAISFSHASSDPAIAERHLKILRILAKELAVLERVIQQGSFLIHEPNPTAWEILRQQQQGG
jgi:hypothetical protein